MKILVLADIEECKWEGGEGEADLVIACGDMLDSVIIEAARAFRCSSVFAVKGNHDYFEEFTPPIRDLHLFSHHCKGLSLCGFNGSWRYKPRGYYLYDQWEATDLLRNLPGSDIFVAHNSPLGVHDKNDDVHTGFQAFNDYIATKRPRLFLHGHQHVNAETVVGSTRVIGVHGHRLLTL